MDVTPYIGTIAAVLTAMGGTYAAVSARLAKLEALIGELRRDVEKHNRVVERTFKLEGDVATAFRRIDELREADGKLEGKIERMM